MSLRNRFLEARAAGDRDAALAAIQSGLDLYAQRRLEPLLELFDPEIEWVPPQRSIESPVTGRSAVRQLLESGLEAWERVWLEADDLRFAGDRVLVAIRQRGRGRLSGAEVEARVAFAWTLCGDRVCRFETIADVGGGLDALLAGRTAQRASTAADASEVPGRARGGMSAATQMPEAAVRPATTAIAAGKSIASARTPATSPPAT